MAVTFAVLALWASQLRSVGRYEAIAGPVAPFLILSIVLACLSLLSLRLP